MSELINLYSFQKPYFRIFSRSWQSLNRVRWVHLSVSSSASKAGKGIISQAEIAFTAMGFMAFALVKSHMMGIPTDDHKGREGFVHVWAVILYMLGLRDEFNFCLNDVKVVEIVLSMALRYICMPLIQIEPKNYMKMISAAIDGLSKFAPDLTVSSQLFMVRRLCGLPGYQFGVNLDKENICPDMYTGEEISAIKREMNGLAPEFMNCSRYMTKDPVLYEPSGDIVSSEIDDTKLFCKYMGLDENDNDGQLIATIVPVSLWRSHLNDKKFGYLSYRDQITIRMRCLIVRLAGYRVFKFFADFLYDQILDRMAKYLDNENANKSS